MISLGADLRPEARQFFPLSLHVLALLPPQAHHVLTMALGAGALTRTIVVTITRTP